MQDLREISKQVEDIHPTVPNPYNLFSTLSPSHIWYMVLGVRPKGCIFLPKTMPTEPTTVRLQMEGPRSWNMGQLTWTRLPQGFKNSPTLFEEALHQDLASFRKQHSTIILLQYMDNLLLAAPSEEDCITGTLLQILGELGYHASNRKAQIRRTRVTHLGYQLENGQKWLTDTRKKTAPHIPVPQTPRQMCEFLGTAGFCRLWILGFAEIAAPLYPLTKQGAPFVWTEDHQRHLMLSKKPYCQPLPWGSLM